MGPKKSPKNRPPIWAFLGSQKSAKNDPYLIFRGPGGGPKNGTPSRAPKSEILLLFTTLELGPTSQKGTPFWSHFGDLFSQKNEKRGFQKSPKNHSQKTLKMGPQWGPQWETKSQKNETWNAHLNLWGPKVAPSRPKAPKLTQNGSQNHPKSTQNGSQNGRFSSYVLIYFCWFYV